MPDPETLPVFDPQTVKSLRSQPGGATFVDAVFRAFLSDVGEAHGTLARAFGEQDFRAIGRTAHRIRGAAASVGASQVEQRCVSLQQAAEERSVGAIAGHITRFSSEARRRAGPVRLLPMSELPQRPMRSLTCGTTRSRKARMLSMTRSLSWLKKSNHNISWSSGGIARPPDGPPSRGFR